MANQAGKSGGPSPKGMAGGIGSILLLGGALMVGNNALFNVDGGHRAIKYTRVGGVSKEIYGEGTQVALDMLKLWEATDSFLQEPISRSHGSKPR